MTEYMDIVERFRECVKKFPEKTALIYPSGTSIFGRVNYKTISYRELHEHSNRYSHGFKKLGLRDGDRVLCLIPPGLEFITLTFALCKLRATPVFIDPGMGKRSMLQCIQETEATAMVGSSLAHALRKLNPRFFQKIKHFVSTDHAWLTGSFGLDKIFDSNTEDVEYAPLPGTHPFLVAFTTGSTGTPKGVVYLQRTMDAQIRSIRSDLGLNESEIILEGFIPFSLRDIAMGTTCIMPLMNPSKPSSVNPGRVVSAIQDFHPTFSFGSPAFWHRILKYCEERGARLPSIKNIMLAGAPISPGLIRKLKLILHPDAEVHTPYGATEALPITSITGKDILDFSEAKTNEGLGICVGKPLTGVEVRIMTIVDQPVTAWSSSLLLDTNEIGEIIVKGDVVTGSYFNRPNDTTMHKIPHGNVYWHRMGDVGYIDAEGRLWYCGRKNDRVIMKDRTLFTIQCEAIMNLHEDVNRSALVAVGVRGNQRPVVVIEPHKGKMPLNSKARQQFIEKFLALSREHEVTDGIHDFLFRQKLPMDYRHNAKILRNELAMWAERMLL